MTPQPFTIDVSQAVLDDLRERLARTRWTDQIAGSKWDYGIDLDYLRGLVDYWQTGYDWRAQEARLNQFDHLRADINGVGIHFIHARGKGDSPMPLLLLHGWPSSFVQMVDLIPLLSDPASHGGDAADAFDVVAASLPGFGFSDIPKERGMSVARMAGLFHSLMTGGLGYERYAARGSDLGAGVIIQLAVSQATALTGIHLSGTNPYVPQAPPDLTAAEEEYVAKAQQWMQAEGAYALMHASKPQTLAVGLNDSPAGLAAWIGEKLWSWSDHDGDLESAISRDQVLTNLTIYWATETIHSSTRAYYESGRDPGQQGRIEIPAAYLMSSRDYFPTPREWIERFSGIDRWTPIDRGGHFLEWEIPEIVAEDMRAFFRTLR